MATIIDPRKSPKLIVKLPDRHAAEVQVAVEAVQAAVQDLDISQRIDFVQALRWVLCFHCFSPDPRCRCWDDD